MSVTKVIHVFHCLTFQCLPISVFLLIAQVQIITSERYYMLQWVIHLATQCMDHGVPQWVRALEPFENCHLYRKSLTRHHIAYTTIYAHQRRAVMI